MTRGPRVPEESSRQFLVFGPFAAHNSVEEVTQQVTYGDVVFVEVFVVGDDVGETARCRYRRRSGRGDVMMNVVVVSADRVDANPGAGVTLRGRSAFRMGDAASPESA